MSDSVQDYNVFLPDNQSNLLVCLSRRLDIECHVSLLVISCFYHQSINQLFVSWVWLSPCSGVVGVYLVAYCPIQLLTRRKITKQIAYHKVQLCLKSSATLELSTKHCRRQQFCLSLQMSCRVLRTPDQKCVRKNYLTAAFSTGFGLFVCSQCLMYVSWNILHFVFSLPFGVINCRDVWSMVDRIVCYENYAPRHTTAWMFSIYSVQQQHLQLVNPKNDTMWYVTFEANNKKI